MAAEWTDHVLGEIASFAYGKMPTSNVLAQGDYPTFSGYKYQYKYPEFNCEKGDVIVVARGVGGTGDVKLVRERCYLTNLSIKITLNPSKADNRFFYYNYLNSSLRHLDSGSAQSQITINDLSREPITLPPLVEQKAIAAVLVALDDKIELNRQMNATLEAMARALFQSWFVDFDPVRAKLDNRQPVGMDAATAALFPTSVEDSPQGVVPQGWKYQQFSDVADINWGDTSTTKASYVENGFTAYSASGPDGLLPTFAFNRPGVVVSAIGANAGVTWLAYGKWSCIKNTLRFWTTDSKLSTEFLFYSTEGCAKWPQRGSAQPFISQGDARAMQILVPSNCLGNYFGDCVRPWLSKVRSNEAESCTLANLRDTLLPKLLSGELRVPDAERFVEEAI